VSFTTHVFISYAHADNLEADGPGWVSKFHALLEPYLTSRLKRTPAVIWRDKRLSDNDDFGPVIMKQLPDSAVFVAVLSDNYVESEWCQREARSFCEVAEKGVGLAPNDKQRIFKVLKLPPERLDPLPEPMRRSIGTRFYVRVDKDRRETQDEHDYAMELDAALGAAYAERLRLQVVLLAQDIANTLKVVNATSGVTPSASSAKPTVYLAECGGDRRQDRQTLRGGLVQAGYTVLPDRELPTAEAEYRAEVARMLERSALSVHLLGTLPGEVPDGVGLDSELVIQNALSVERARVAPLRRVVSLPAGTVCARQIHQQFLDAMLRDPAVLGGAEVITGDLETVKAAIREALATIEKPAPIAAPLPAVSPSAGSQKPSIYVVYDRPDMPATGELRDALGEHFKVVKPVFDGTPEEKRQANKQRLTDCDAVLVFYGAGTDGWMDSVSSELEQAAAWRAGRPFTGVFRWIAAPVTDDKLDALRKPRPDVIDAFDGFSPERLAPILKALNGAGRG
jgi:hypothetical protein